MTTYTKRKYKQIFLQHFNNCGNNLISVLIADQPKSSLPNGFAR